MAEDVVFGPFRLDLAAGRLLRGEREVDIRPRPLALLCHLAARPGVLVSRAELLASVWGGVHVDPGVVKVAMHSLRDVLGEGVGAHYLETVGRRGYRFVDVATAAAPERSARPRPGCVGRRAEIATLHEHLDRACEGRRQVVFVTGEAGIGKTTVVDRFVAGVAPRARVARGQCQERYGEGEPYLPIHDALRSLCDGPDGGEVKALLRRCAPSWLAQQPSLTSEEERAALQRTLHGATQERLLRELAEAIEVLSAAHPLVLVLEDLHWSDASTIELVARLAQRREDARLMLVGTYRSTDPALREHPLHDVTRELAAKRLAVEVPLALLDETEVVAYVEPFVGGGEASVLGRAVYARTGGNPLFMVNVVDELWAEGTATFDDGVWRLSADPELVSQRIPDALRGLIEKQLARLAPEERAALEAASVVGQAFSAAAVAAALGQAPETVDECCEDLADLGQLVEGAGSVEWPDGTVSGRYRFRHALYVDVLRDRIPPTRLARMHRLVAERIEAAYGAAAREHAALLAAHFEAGGRREDAGRYHDLAGESALRQSAHGVALGHFRKALELLGPEHDRGHELALHTKIGMSYAAARGYTAPEAERAFANAVALSEGLEDRIELFSAYRGLREFFLVRGEIPQTRAFAEQLHRLAIAHGDPLFMAEAQFSLGSVRFYAGELEAARAAFEVALAAVSKAGAPADAITYTHDPIATTLSELALTLWQLGCPDEARARSAEAVAAAETRVHPLGRAHAYSFDAILQQSLDDVAAVRARAAAVRRIAVEHDFPHWLAMSCLLEGWTAVREGDPAAGVELLQTGIGSTEAIGARLGLAYWRVTLAQALGAMGRRADGLAVVVAERERIERTGERGQASQLHRVEGELRLLGPDPREADAEACFMRAIDVASRGGARTYELAAALALARLWRNLGRGRDARAMLERRLATFTPGAVTPEITAATAFLAGTR